MTEPTTEAGRRLLEEYLGERERGPFVGDILAIEAEARDGVLTRAPGLDVLDKFGPMTFGPGCGPFDHPIGCQCPYPAAAAERDRLVTLTRAGLDVERLARAIMAGQWYGPDDYEDAHLAASLIAREYAALASEDRPHYTEDDPDWAAMVSPINEKDGGHDDR